MWHHSSLRPYLSKPRQTKTHPTWGPGGNLKTLVTTSCVEPWEAQSHCEAKILMLELLPMEDNGGQFAVGKVRLCCPRSQLLWATISHELYQILYVPLSSFVEWLRERESCGGRARICIFGFGSKFSIMQWSHHGYGYDDGEEEEEEENPPPLSEKRKVQLIPSGLLIWFCKCCSLMIDANAMRDHCLQVLGNKSMIFVIDLTSAIIFHSSSGFTKSATKWRLR